MKRRQLPEPLDNEPSQITWFWKSLKAVHESFSRIIQDLMYYKTWVQSRADWDERTSRQRRGPVLLRHYLQAIFSLSKIWVNSRCYVAPSGHYWVAVGRSGPAPTGAWIQEVPSARRKWRRPLTRQHEISNHFSETKATGISCLSLGEGLRGKPGQGVDTLVKQDSHESS